MGISINLLEISSAVIAHMINNPERKTKSQIRRSFPMPFDSDKFTFTL
jgi:hypothetical protein